MGGVGDVKEEAGKALDRSIMRREKWEMLKERALKGSEEIYLSFASMK